MTPRFDGRACHGVILALERARRVNQDVHMQTSKDVGQIPVVSVECYRVFSLQTHGERSDTRPPKIPATNQHSQGRARGKCGADTLTKESVAAQHKDCP